MLRLLTFDLEGTLIDLELIHHSAHLSVSRQLGLDLTLEEARSIIPSFVGGPDIAIAEELCKLSKTDKAVSEVFELMRHQYLRFRQYTRIMARPGARDFIKDAELQGLSIALGSVTTRSEAESLLRAADLSDIFDDKTKIVFEDVSRTKPTPDVYLATAAAAGVSVEEQLVFEDSPIGVEAARRAGSNVIGMPVISTPSIRQEMVRNGAMMIFENWHDISLSLLLKTVNVS
jgi:HAD superfamily hydrolase (TIGR01509 family)